jgi:hypothetical protein
MGNDTRKKVMIAIPTDHSIHHSVVGVLCQILLQGKHDITTYISTMRGIGEHRNKIVEAFLETDMDYLMMMDADNPCPNNVLDLLGEEDIISLPTPINMNWMGVTNIFWNVWKDGKPTKDTGVGLQEVDKAGTGCIIIRRHVLEKLKNPFTEVRDETGLRTVGTDIAFSNKCKKAGFKIYCAWDYPCRHYKDIDLLTIKDRIL